MYDSLKQTVKHLKIFTDLKSMQYQASVRWKTEFNLRACRTELELVSASQIYLLFSTPCLN